MIRTMEVSGNDDALDDDAVYFMKAKDVKLTVEEAVIFFGMKNSDNVTSVPPVLPKTGELYLFVNNNPPNQVFSYIMYE